MHIAPTETVPHTHKGEMTMMDTQINYSDEMMSLRRDAISISKTNLVSEKISMNFVLIGC